MGVMTLGAQGSWRDEDAPSETAEVQLVPAVSRDAEFSAFMAGALGPLGRMALLLAGDTDRAKELVQQTMVRVYLSWGKARAGDPLAYARRILLNQRIDTWRRRRREVLVEPARLTDLEGTVAEPAAPRHEELVTALRGLNEKSRRVVVLRYVEGLSEAEVAVELGIPLGTVKSCASRALTQMRQHLSDHGR